MCCQMTLELLIKEDSKMYIPHDQLFKQLIHTFFAEFMEAFFPEIQEHIDFSVLKPLSEQMYTDLIDGESRTVDILIETKLKNEDTIIIIHIEPQSYHQTNFNERMFQYFSLIYQRERKPILPIAIFSYDEKRYEKSQFTISFPFKHVLTFELFNVGIKKNELALVYPHQ